jgi:hypothetical protein
MPYALLIVILSVCGLGQAAIKPRGERSAPVPDTQVIFWGPEELKVVCDTGSGQWYDSEPLVVPFRLSFRQGVIYSLKLVDMPGHPGIELSATLAAVLAAPRATVFLERNAISVTLAEKDIATACSGKPVTKVTYLNSENLHSPGETTVSCLLDPSADPITECGGRGDVLVVLRIERRSPSATQHCDRTRPARAFRSARFAVAFGVGHRYRWARGRESICRLRLAKEGVRK